MKYPETSKRILELIKTLGINQVELANLARVSKTAVGKWVKGDTQPREDAVEALKRSPHRINPEYIRGRSNEMFLRAITTQQLSEEEMEWLSFYHNLSGPKRRAITSVVDWCMEIAHKEAVHIARKLPKRRYYDN